MIIKKIPNPKKSASKAQRAKGLTDYITAPEHENGLEKCLHHEGANFLTNTLAGQTSEMIALSQEAVKSPDPIDHWVISWQSDERPTTAQARAAIEMFIAHCGLDGHQYVWGLHDDTENLHVHIAVNRVNPDTLRVTKINKGFDKEAAQQALALIEYTQGWKQETGARYDIENGKPIKREQDPTKARKPSTKAQAMEIQTGEKSAERIGIESAAPIIATAKNWKELHDGLAAIGMRYEREGSGAKVYVGDIGIKASDVDRKASFGALQKRLGAYQPTTTRREIKSNEYHHHTIDNPYKQDFASPEPLSGHCLRQLSSSRLAHSEKNWQGKTRSEGVLQIDERASRFGANGMRRGSDRDRAEGSSRKQISQPMRPGQHGWEEYITIRDTQKAAKSHDTTELQTRHGAERAALLAKLKAERDEVLAGNWKSKGDLRNAMQSVLATQQAAAKLELSEQHKAERQALQAKYKPLPMYKQWKEQPLIVCEAVRPLIDQHITRDRQPSALVQMLRALSHSTDSRQHITYQFAGKDIFRDEGRTIQILDLKSDRGIAAALVTAQQKFGNVLTLTGSSEFQQNAVAVAVENGLTCRFSDPALDTLREQLQAEKYQSEHTAAAADRAADLAKLAEAHKKVQEEKAEAEKAAQVKAAEAAKVVDAAKTKEAERLSEPVQLADIHKQIAAAKADGLADKQVVLAPDGPHEAQGPIVANNETFVAVATGRDAITIYRADQLASNIEYDGLAMGHDRFARGNEIEIKRSPDGIKAVVNEEREALQTEQKKQRELDRGHGI